MFGSTGLFLFLLEEKAFFLALAFSRANQSTLVLFGSDSVMCGVVSLGSRDNIVKHCPN